MRINLFSTTIYSHLKDNFGIFDDDLLPAAPAKVVLFENGIAKVEKPNKK
jgi:hypothetical protein